MLADAAAMLHSDRTVELMECVMEKQIFTIYAASGWLDCCWQINDELYENKNWIERNC